MIEADTETVKELARKVAALGLVVGVTDGDEIEAATAVLELVLADLRARGWRPTAELHLVGRLAAAEAALGSAEYLGADRRRELAASLRVVRTVLEAPEVEDPARS